MKFLFSSDFHSHEAAFSAFARTLEQGPFDAGILAGDLLDEWMPPAQVDALLAGPVPEAPAARLTLALERRRDQLRAVLESAGKPVFFVLGNHDVTPWPDSELLTNLHLRAVVFQGCRLVGYRWTRMDRYPDELERDLADLHPLVDGDTVLVTHSPPWDVLDGEPGARFRFGLKTLHRLTPPRLHLFGHVHESAGVRGTCVNGSYPLLRRFFSVDSETGTASEWGTMP